MKGNPRMLNRGLDCDVIVAEVRATSHKPDEVHMFIFHQINFSLNCIIRLFVRCTGLLKDLALVPGK